jgi:hypothetical protein
MNGVEAVSVSKTYDFNRQAAKKGRKLILTSDEALFLLCLGKFKNRYVLRIEDGLSVGL